MTLRYSGPAQATRVLFFAPYNDVTIVVEDSTQENFYTMLMQRLFGDTIRIGKVVGVGGKPQVLERLSRKVSEDRLGNEFYLIDGDLDQVDGFVDALADELGRVARCQVSRAVKLMHFVTGPLGAEEIGGRGVANVTGRNRRHGGVFRQG